MTPIRRMPHWVLSKQQRGNKSDLELRYLDVRLCGQHEAGASRNRAHALLIAQACILRTMSHASKVTTLHSTTTGHCVALLLTHGCTPLLARCAATSEEEHAVSVDMQGPVRAKV